MRRTVVKGAAAAMVLLLLGACASEQAPPPEPEPVQLDVQGEAMAQSGDEADSLVASKTWTATTQVGGDFGRLVLDGPAGKYGFVESRDGHFVLGDTGERIRFWGVNMVFSANFPATRERAEAIADDLADMGVNLVRLHGIDSANGERATLFSDYTKNTLTLSPTQLDRLDYFIGALKRRGIYIDLNLTAKRLFTEGDGVSDPALVSSGGALKSLQLMDPVLIGLQTDFVTALMSHTNPYTGLTYAQEPAIAMIEPNNELSLYRTWTDGGFDDAITDHYDAVIQTQWNAFLREKYGTDSALRAGWQLGDGALPPLGSVPWIRKAQIDDYTSAALLDFSEFLYTTEADYYRQMQTLLRDLGAVQPVGGNNQYSGIADLAAGADMDFTNSHRYFDHPQFASGWSTEHFTMTHASLVRAGASEDTFRGSLYGVMALSAVADKPHVVSEWGHPFPNPYEYESTILTAAVARLQDWDAMILFAYSHSDRESDHIDYWFDIKSNPVKRAQMPTAALLFVRGDITPLADALVLDYTWVDTLQKGLLNVYDYSLLSDAELPPAVIFDRLLRRGSFHADATTKISDIYSVAEIAALYNPSAHTASNGQLTWYGTDGKEYVQMDTPRLQSFIGFISGQYLSAGNLSLEMAAGSDGAVSLLSLTDDAIAQSPLLLLTACGRQSNIGQQADGGGLRSWGSGGVELQSLQGRVTIALSEPGRYVVYALSSAGEPEGLVPAELLGDSAISFQMEASTLRYQLVREDGDVAGP